MNTVNVRAYTNERLFIPINLSEWAGVYDLATASFWAQVRRVGHRAEIALDFTKSPSSIAYSPTTKILSLISPQSHVDVLAGEYEWDFGFSTSGNVEIRIGGGTFVIGRGTTEHGGI